jgi:hypothetical protein
MRKKRMIIRMCGLVALAVCGAEDPVCVTRQGLPNASRIWRAKTQNGCVFYAGCTTQTPRGQVRNRVPPLVVRAFPGAKGVFPFISWGRAYPDNCSSVIETFRAMSDGPSVSPETSWPNVALTLIDLSDQDIGQTERQVRAALEGLVHRTRQRNPARDMLMLHQPEASFVAAYRAGRTPDVIRWYEEIAEHYGIPSVNLAKAAARKPEWKGAQEEWDALLRDELGAFFSWCAAQPAQAQPVRHACPSPLTPTLWNRATLVNYERGDLDPAGWLGWQWSPVDAIFHVAVCEKPGPVMTLYFTGTAAGLYGVTGPDSGDLEVAIDDGPWQRLAVFDPQARDNAYHLFHRMFADELPDTRHAVRIRVAEAVPSGSTGRVARIGWLTVNGRDASPMGSLSPVALADTLFLQLEPIAYRPPPGRWSRIPKTMERLRSGGTVRMVMLGDSIINNIQSSHFERLIERAYPGSRIEKIVSVRGSTGCWYYQEPEHLQNYVLRHKPDLLVIGGISQKGDVEAIRSVIRQTRAALPEVEVVVMTDVYGGPWAKDLDPYDPKNAADPDPAGTGYRDRLFKMAGEERVEYVNITQPWMRHLTASKQPLGAFKSDAVHANARGSQLIGRFLELYFAPDGWDAYGTAKRALKP